MKIVATKANLVRVLTQCSLVAKPKATTPVLSCCLLETTAKGLSGVATDLYHTVSTFAPCDVATAGGIAVNARELLDRVKTLPEGPVTVETDKDRLVVSVGKRKHRIPTVHPDEFPRAVPTGAVNGFEVGGSTLTTLLSKTKPMALQDPNRALMHGVLLEFTDGVLRATSTDSHRVSTLALAAPNVKAAPEQLVPLEAVETLLGLLDDETPVTLAMGQAELAFALGPELTFYSKPTADKFPPYRNAMETVPAHAVVVGRETLKDALISIEKPTDATDRGRFSLTASPGRLTLKAEGKGAAEDEIDATYDGEEATIWANSRYLLDALATIETDDVRLNFGGVNDFDPIWLRPSDDSDVTQLVMPLHAPVKA